MTGLTGTRGRTAQSPRIEPNTTDQKTKTKKESIKSFLMIFLLYS